MSVKNVSDFIKILKKNNQLLTITKEIDPILEISEITDRICKSKENNKAILFENPKNSFVPVLMNMFGSLERLCLSLGIENIESLGKEIEDILTISPPRSLMEGIKLFPKYGKLFTYHTKTVKRGACQEVIETGDDIDLYKYPILKCWPLDAGQYITLPIVITKDPKLDRLNAGMYRMQVFDKKTTAMHWHKHHDGASNYRKSQGTIEKMEIAVALGGPPSLIFSATAPLPPFIDEFTFACFLMKGSIEMVKCKTISLSVPAEAEIILEGYIDPNEELQMEGPFGDHTGYYSLAELFPTFHITAITRKTNPIYPSIIVGKPPMEDTYMGKLTERIFLPIMKLIIPEIVDINFPAFGVFHNFVFVSIKKEYPYQAKKVMNAIWGMGQMMLTKFIIVVEDNVDVQNENEVLWKMANNVDPIRDTLVVEGPLDQLDHSSPYPLGGAKMGFDATTRFKEEGKVREYPEEIIMTEEVKKKIDSIWNTLF